MLIVIALIAGFFLGRYFCSSDKVVDSIVKYNLPTHALTTDAGHREANMVLSYITERANVVYKGSAIHNEDYQDIIQLIESNGLLERFDLDKDIIYQLSEFHSDNYTHGAYWLSNFLRVCHLCGVKVEFKQNREWSKRDIQQSVIIERRKPSLRNARRTASRMAG